MRLLLALCLLFAAPSARAEELLVFAAVSTTEAMTELGAAFTAQTGTRVVFSFAGSNELARQIKAGAPADLFLSADAKQMAGLVPSHVAPAAVIPLLSNRLVVVIPTRSKVTLKDAKALATLPRVAVADPAAVPAGVYARQWLEAEKVWAQVSPRVIPTLDVRAALDAVATGNADAAVVYQTDAALRRPVKVALKVPESATPSITYPLAVLSASKHPEEAKALATFLQTPQARAAFEKRGFLVMKP